VEIYSAADVFLNPTYIDNYPTVNLEALACRTPVLTYKTGGSAECLNGKNGKSFNKGDIESIAEFLMTQFRNTEFGFDDSNVLDMSTTCQKYMSVYMNMN
jgi:glycosyltransferase involved in cell wall biosynthesis